MKVTLLNVLETSFEDQMRIREWRNSEQITSKFLIPYIDEETHKNWLQSMAREKPKNIAFVIVVDGQKVGIEYFHSVDYVNLTAESGVFIVPEAQKLYPGVGLAAGYLAMEYIFNQIKLEKINAEVLGSNKKVLRGNLKFGYKQEGVRRGVILRDDVRYDVHLLGMFREEWLAKKDFIYGLVKDCI